MDFENKTALNVDGNRCYLAFSDLSQCCIFFKLCFFCTLYLGNVQQFYINFRKNKVRCVLPTTA